MKKFLLFILSIGTTITVFAQGFMVSNCNVEIFLHKEGYFDVVENYDLEFNVPKHGIFRTIKTDYTLLDEHGKKSDKKIRISDVQVPNYKFKTPFAFVQKLENSFEIKIGDKNTMLTGPQHYEIKYRVDNAFMLEENQIRLYWNVKPDGWAAIFKKISFTIHAPDGVVLNKENCFVYSGTTGDTTTSKDIQLSFKANVLEGESADIFFSAPGQSVTVLMNLPKDSIDEIIPKFSFISDYGWLLFIAFLFLIYFLIWLKYGKDDHVVSAINYYPPKDIDPAMAGLLIDDKGDNCDLIALIPYWGANGNLKMEEIPKTGFFGRSDVKLTQLKPLPASASLYEQTIFSGIFGGIDITMLNGILVDNNNPTMAFINQILQKNNIDFNLNKSEVLISSLRNTFYSRMTSAKTILSAVAEEYYVNESKKVQKIVTIILVVLAVLLCPLFLFLFGVIAAVSIVVACVFLIFMNYFMIKKNGKGNQVFADLRGFKQFIKVADENRLTLLLKEDPTYFEKTMAYALAFGMFEKWAKKFDALNLQPPNWYASSNRTTSSIVLFSKSFSSSISGMQSSMVSSPSSSGSSSSSGGGSSGGGFGGGGGGSW